MSEGLARPSPLAIGTQFFWIGCVAFGGFMALISVIEEVLSLIHISEPTRPY